MPSDGKWRVVYESSHRTGAGATQKTDALRRAREAKGLGADRRFLDERLRTVMSSVSTFATEQDAASRIPLIPSSLVRKPFSQFKPQYGQILVDHEISSAATHLVYEEPFTDQNGSGTTRLVAGNVDRIVFVLWCSASGDPWDWTVVNELVEILVNRIRTDLLEESP
jgi:hypothetical protein